MIDCVHQQPKGGGIHLQLGIHGIHQHSEIDGMLQALEIPGICQRIGEIRLGLITETLPIILNHLNFLCPRVQ